MSRQLISLCAMAAFGWLLVGCSGEDGPPGANGRDGTNGATGPIGPRGATGPAGPMGATGPIGLVGATGPLGATGPAGASGPAGATGPTGEIGQTGTPGATGTTGAPGAMGLTGATGSTGPTGANGLNSAVHVTPESAGSNCAYGGKRVDIGTDLNGNHTLDGGEIESTTFLCTSPMQLVSVTNEPVGTHCTSGGQRISQGLDLDADGILDPGEIDGDAIQYVCNAATFDNTSLQRTVWSMQYETPGIIESVASNNINNAPAPSNALTITQLGRTTYDPTLLDKSAAEIVAFNPITKQIYATKALAAALDVFPVDAVGAIGVKTTLNLVTDVPTATGVNSVSYHDGFIAVAIEVVTNAVQQRGFIAFYDVNSTTPVFKAAIPCGVMPDMVTFSPDGLHVVSANEGEPPSDYSVDPEGSITVITRPSAGWAVVAASDATTLDFTAFNPGAARAAELPATIRKVGPQASTMSQTLEPEYVAVAPDGHTAWVGLQEANAVAVINLDSPSISTIRSWGAKDGLKPNNSFDASDKDSAVRIVNWPVYAMYQPDTMASFTVDGNTYFVTANEGDIRDDGWSWREDARLKDVNLDPQRFPNAAYWKDNSRLGRLKITTVAGDIDGDGDLDDVYSFGARSFSIWTSQTGLVWDSGNQFETITGKLFGSNFNNDHATNSPDGRSDDKGPEPEALAVGTIGSKRYAFIGLERTGGFFAYDITTPAAPKYDRYVNNRNFGVDAAVADAGDLGPESILFVPATDSPLTSGAAMLVIGNEVSGTVTIYSVQ